MTDTAGTTRSGNNANKQLSQRTLGIRQKQTEAARLYAEGWTLEQIAVRVGYASRASAGKAVKAVLARAESVEADSIRVAHGDRLAAGYRVAYEVLNRQYPVPVVPDGMDAVDGQKWVDRVTGAIEDLVELRLKAVDRLVRLMEREARLHGLDAPTKLTTDGDGTINMMVDPALMPMQWRLANGFKNPTAEDLKPTPPAWSSAPRRYEVES